MEMTRLCCIRDKAVKHMGKRYLEGGKFEELVFGEIID
jgi:hypothetical protein